MQQRHTWLGAPHSRLERAHAAVLAAGPWLAPAARRNSLASGSTAPFAASVALKSLQSPAMLPA